MKTIPHFEYKTNNGKFEVIKDWEHSNIYGTWLKVPKGYKTNGASIPRAFWWILSPFDPRYLEECTIHDYLCDQGLYKRADDWFEQLLIDNTAISAWHRWLFIAGVKAWHKVAYKEAGYFDRAEPRYLIKKWSSK